MRDRNISNNAALFLIILGPTIGVVSSLLCVVLGELFYALAFLFLTIMAVRIFLDFREFVLGDMNPMFVRQTKVIILHYEDMLKTADTMLKEMADQDEVNKVAIQLLQSQVQHKQDRNSQEDGNGFCDPDKY